MKTRRRFYLVHIVVALLVAVWAFGSSNVNASEPPPAHTLPEYTGGLRYNHVKPYVGEEVQPGVDVNASNLVGNESEVSIDVNPTNPNNQVIVGHAPGFATMNTFFTLDGGQTWTLVALGNAQDGLTSNFRFDPTVAFDDNGNVYAGYGVRTATGVGTNTQRTVVVCQSTDGGQTYPQCTQVATTADIDTTGDGVTNLPGNDKWHLATGPDPFTPTQQNVYIAWTQNVTEGATVDQRIVVSGSIDGGATFSAPLIIADDAIAGIDRALFADPAVGPNGELYVAWHDFGANQVLVDVSLDGGATFGTDNLVTNSAFNGLSEAIPPQPDRQVPVGPTIDANRSNTLFSDRLYVTYTDIAAGGLPDTDIFVQFSDDNGTTWSAATRVNDDGGTNSQFLPWLDVDQLTGLVSVVWYDARNDVNNQMVDTFIAVSTDGGATFQANILVSDAQSDQSTNNPNRTINNFLEYIGIATFGCEAFPVWSDNSVNAADLDFFTDQVRVCAPATDVYFVVDLSGSFIDDLPNFQAEAPGTISTLLAANPDTQFGLGIFQDYPIPDFGRDDLGDKAYERLVDIGEVAAGPISNSTLVLNTIAGLSAVSGAGGDAPQSQLPALFQAATGAGQDLSATPFPGASIPAGQQANFRNGATKLFLLFTDAPFHDPGDPGDIPYPGPSFTDTVNAILALDPPKVIGILSGTDTDALADLEAIATATGAFAPPDGVDCDGDGTIDVAPGEPLVCSTASTGVGIGDAITAIVEAATLKVIDIHPNSDINPINRRSRGVVPVAVLGTAAFDVTDVDVTTLAFGPNGAAPAHDLSDPAVLADHLHFVNDDGFTDLVSHYRQKDTGIPFGATQACLIADLTSGGSIDSCDSVRVK